MFTNTRTRFRKMAIALALVGLFGGATATPALADHNSGNGNKVGHDNGKAKGHAKQDARNNTGPTLEEQKAQCEAEGGEWIIAGTFTDADGNVSFLYRCESEIIIILGDS